MRPIWMGISPWPTETRILVLDGPGQALLKARLPYAPRHPRALASFCEALALWCGRKVHAALAADGSDTFCAEGRWRETFETLEPGPLFEIEYVARARPPRERDGLDGLGDFRDCRRIILCGVAR